MLERFAYRTARGIARRIIKTHNIHAEELPEIKGNYLIIANHSNFYDPATVMTACKETSYFVLGEDLYRKQNIKLIERLCRPIYVSQSGGTPLVAMREIYNRIRSGENIIMFPEGHYSYTSRTEDISKSNAGFVKMLGCTLVTYRIEGGYYNFPYWSGKCRKGPVRGRVAGIYSSEELSQMSDDELNDLIRTDLYTDADKYQDMTGYLYPGINKAEGLENILTICPKCGRYNSIETHGDVIKCMECGSSSIYTDRGTIEGDFPFERVSEWQSFIEDRVSDDIKRNSFSNIKYNNAVLSEMLPDHKINDIGRDDLVISDEAIHICGRIFRYEDFKECTILYHGNTLFFMMSDGYYGIYADRFSAGLVSTIIKTKKQ